MSQAAVPLQHPFQRCAQGVAVALDEAADSSPVYLSTEAKREVLTGLSAQIDRLEGMRLAVIATAGEVAEDDGARSAGLWLAVEARLERPEGRRLQKLADALDRRYAAVAAALMSGEVSRPQAEVIVSALEELPDRLDPGLRAKAEAHLVEAAAEFGPRELRVLGRRVLEVVAPAVAEEQEQEALERAERRARRRMRVTRRELGDGLVRFTADIPVLHADLLYTQLHAYASPRRDHLENVDRRDPESGERIPYTRLLAQGFCTLLERLPGTAVPVQGGDAATVVVTLDHDRLADALGVAELDTGNKITAGEARRLACIAGIIPMVLGGESQPLDVGRKRRFHSSGMRKAMAVRDHECRASGCDIPAAWCEAHHLVPWSQGGKTSVEDGALLCGFHHHRAHDRRYEVVERGNGDISFHRRQ